MDAWHRTFDQLRSVFRGLSIAQRVSVLVMSVGVLAGMSWLAWSATRSPDEFLLGGKLFSAEELAQNQAAFKAAGLAKFQVVGQRISIPAKEADRYTAAIITRQTLPAQFAADFDRMQSKVNVFTSSEQRRELLEEARKTRLAQILRSIPEIEDAVVDWDRPRQANLFRPVSQLAAQVSVKPRGGRELTSELVQSLKLFVAGALAGAKTDDVTVVDMNTGRVHGRPSPAESANERAQEFAKRHESEYASQITRALAYIPNVLVTVNLDLAPAGEDSDPRNSFVNPEIVPVNRHQRPRRDTHLVSSNLPSMRPVGSVAAVRVDSGFDVDRSRPVLNRDAAKDQPEFEAEGPNAYQAKIQVAVAVPENYYRDVARARGLNPGQSLVQDSAFRAELASIKAETQQGIRDKLAQLLPRGDDSSAISVTTYTPLKPVTDQVNLAAETTQFPFGASVTDWKTGTGVAICGACLSCLLFWFRPRRAVAPISAPTAELPAETQVEAAKSASSSDGDDVYPELNPHPHAAVLAELAELDRRAPAPAVQRNNSFAFLTELAIWDAARLLASEHPQTIALVATALAPTQAAEILRALPESLRWDVTQRLTRIGAASPDVLSEVAESLKSRLANFPGSESESSLLSRRQTPQSFADHESAATRHDHSADVVDHAPAIAPQSSPFAFDDLRLLDFRSLATVLESIDLRACAVAMLDQSESFKQALLALMPKHMAQAVRQHLRQIGPVRLIDITTSQQAIAGIAWNLSVHGMIALPSTAQAG